MWNTILAIIGCISGLGALLAVGIWVGTVNDFLKLLRQDREKYPPDKSYLMLSTLWETYILDPLHKRPDLAQSHSPCALTTLGLEQIPEDVKKELDALVSSVGRRKELATGYLVVQQFGLSRLGKMADANKLSLQEQIAVMSTYLAECREKE